MARPITVEMLDEVITESTKYYKELTEQAEMCCKIFKYALISMFVIFLVSYCTNMTDRYSVGIVRNILVILCVGIMVFSGIVYFAALVAINVSMGAKMATDHYKSVLLGRSSSIFTSVSRSKSGKSFFDRLSFPSLVPEDVSSLVSSAPPTPLSGDMSSDPAPSSKSM